MRHDLYTVEKWLPAQSYILDIGCGNGELLELLRRSKQIEGVGIEICEDKIQACLEKNVAVIDIDMTQALENFADNSFDAVIMTQTLQVTRDPHLVLEQALRVGREAIIAFPNFAHWTNRLYLGAKGKMPVSETLPYSWFDTPNIHFFTVNDFSEYCEQQQIQVLDRRVLSTGHKPSRLTRLLPNVFGSIAIYRIKQD